MTKKRRKVLKIIFIVFGGLCLIFGCLYSYAYYMFKEKYVPSNNKYEERVAFIAPEESLHATNFETCNEYIYDYYNPQRPTYSAGKNGLRKFILKNYQNRGYSDSGYLNIRFVINCKGETGRYIIHENNLNLKKKTFSTDLKKQLFELTTQLNKWNPNVIRGAKVDSYMYISYRIENGEILEIIP